MPAAAPAAVKAPEPGKVFVVIPEGSTSPIVPYKNGTHGYMQLTSQVLVMEKQWPRMKKRSMLYKAEIDVLEYILENEVNKKDRSLPGQLVIREFVYNDEFLDPENEDARPYASQLDMDIEDEEERIANVVKRDGSDDAPILKVGDDPIVRFTEYDHDRTESDVLVQYDNHDEIRESRLERAEAKKAAKKRG